MVTKAEDKRDDHWKCKNCCWCNTDVIPEEIMSTVVNYIPQGNCHRYPPKAPGQYVRVHTEEDCCGEWHDAKEGKKI